MKKEELIFTNDEKKNQWIKSCVFNKYTSGYEQALEILKKASDTKQFALMVINDESLCTTQGYAEIVKNYDEHLYDNSKMEHAVFDIIEKYSTDAFWVDSDAGGVLLKTENFSLVVPNGFGDGEAMVYIFEKDDANKFNKSMFNYFTIIDGRANIMDYDAYDEDENGRDIYNLNGKYQVFYGYGRVFFVGV